MFTEHVVHRENMKINNLRIWEIKGNQTLFVRKLDQSQHNKQQTTTAYKCMKCLNQDDQIIILNVMAATHFKV